MSQSQTKLGLKDNLGQFLILVLVNAFVGGMIGMERSIFPQFAQLEFGITSKTAILSFIAAFGLSKAVTNYFTGRWANRFGRKQLLILGWIIAIPVPLILIYAASWNWVIVANILLGISQGLTWSSTVIMKIDLVGKKQSGLAMGFNEFAGYVAVGIFSFLSGYIANQYGIVPYPFYLGIGLSVIGLLTTLFLVKDTRKFSVLESENSIKPELKSVFKDTSVNDKTLSSVTQAGLVNNLNDGMIWGLFPILLFNLNFDNADVGIITAIYPAVWGISQLFTGGMSDILSRKKMLFWGMLLQGIAIFLIPFFHSFNTLVILSAILGLATALVYPTFLTTIAANTRPNQRAESIGVFRLWRDLGYVFGAIISGVVADYFGLNIAIYLVALITIYSAFVIAIRMPKFA